MSMNQPVPTSEIQPRLDPEIKTGSDLSDLLERNTSAGKELVKATLQLQFVPFVKWTTGFILSWLAIIYTCSVLNVPKSGHAILLPEKDSIIIITAISTNAFVFALAVIKGLFVVNEEQQKK
jgi:hypothetical protein